MKNKKQKRTEFLFKIVLENTIPFQTMRRMKDNIAFSYESIVFEAMKQQRKESQFAAYIRRRVNGKP